MMETAGGMIVLEVACMMWVLLFMEFVEIEAGLSCSSSTEMVNG